MNQQDKQFIQMGEWLDDQGIRWDYAGVDHYLNPREVKRVPNWSKVYPKVAVIRLHEFHKRDH